MAFDRNNNPVIAYLKLNPKQGKTDQDQAMVARMVNGSWTFTAITDGTSIEGFFNSLESDSNGNLYLSYYNYSNNKLFYTYSANNSNSWTTPIIISDAYRKPGNNDDRPRSFVVIDSNQNVHIIYLDVASNKLVYLDGSKNWSRQDIANGIDSTGFSFPVVVDKNNQLVVAYYDKTKGLTVTRLQAGVWKPDTDLDKFGFGLYPSLAYDPTGNLYLSYYDSRNSRLKLAMYDGTRWSDPVTLDENGGMFTNLAIGKDGLVHIAYIGDLNSSTCSLKYTVGSNLSFNKPIVVFPSLPAIGEKYLSLALERGGKPWISFYDSTPGILALKLARQQK
jgi:hypothetical protein